MTIGDLLEWLAAAAFITAAYLWSGKVLALAMGGVALAYFAQCYDGTGLKLPHRRPKTDIDGSAIWRCSKCGGEHYLGLQAGHVCRTET